MSVAALYLAVVLVWGTTWIMISFQIGVVPPEVSVAYRFAIAAALMFAWAGLRGLPLRFRARDHLFIALQGALIFSTNFVLFYLAALDLATGLLAVVFSTASILTMLFSAVRQRRPPPARALGGAALGSCGIALVFWPEIAAFSLSSGAGLGLVLSLGGTVSFSLGGLVAARNQAAGLSVRGTTAWAMTYGTVLLSLFVAARGARFTFDPSFAYVGSLAFLAVVGSVVAFACYFALLERIGPERSAYATVLFPVVALVVSTLFEGYQWTAMALVGVALTLAGNLLVLARPRAALLRA
ncbi:MAG: DMT family transporter [Kiloniellales bacterium]|nr:DMT family transporter [Kiloniellales bacterium]